MRVTVVGSAHRQGVDPAFCWFEARGEVHGTKHRSGGGPSIQDRPCFHGSSRFDGRRSGATTLRRDLAVGADKPAMVMGRARMRAPVRPQATCSIAVAKPCAQSPSRRSGSPGRGVALPAGGSVVPREWHIADGWTLPRRRAPAKAPRPRAISSFYAETCLRAAVGPAPSAQVRSAARCPRGRRRAGFRSPGG